MKNLIALIMIGVLASASISMAQTPDSTKTKGEDQKTMPIQFTFITPMGTNGTESGKFTNNLSVNIFSGYNGGVQGAEFGAFANVIRYDVEGIQMAGFANTVFGEVKGAQFAGFSNVSLGKTQGGQFAGFANVVTDSADAVQAAGFANATTHSFKGIQASGFANFVGGDTKGGQFAGFANITAGDHTGIQISGFVNFARNLKGTQIGYINIADSVSEGIPIGFISLVRKGYHKVEIGGSESLYTSASLKLGVSRFYNIFSLGASLQNSEILWGFGYGIGTELPLKEKLKMNVDLVSYQINEDSWWTFRNHSLNKLNVQVSYQVTDMLTVYAGPSFNVVVSDILDDEGNPYTNTVAPYTMFDKDYDQTKVQMYPGFTAGIRL